VNCSAGIIAMAITGTLSTIDVHSLVRSPRSSSAGCACSAGSSAVRGGGGSSAV
jgi:hypothetical protein